MRPASAKTEADHDGRGESCRGRDRCGAAQPAGGVRCPAGCCTEHRGTGDAPQRSVLADKTASLSPHTPRTAGRRAHTQRRDTMRPRYAAMLPLSLGLLTLLIRMALA